MNPVSKRRLLTTTTGIILTIALIVSSLSVADNASRYVVYQNLKNRIYTFDITADFDNVTEYEHTLKDISSMKKIDNVYGILGFGGNVEYSDTGVFAYLGIANCSYRIVGGRDILHSDEVLIDKYLFSDGININDTVRVKLYGTHTIIKNFTVVGVYESIFYLEGPLMLLNYNDFKELHREFGNGTVVVMDSMFYVKVNTTYLASSSTMKEMNNKVDKTRTDIENIIISNGGDIERKEYGMSYYEGNSLLWDVYSWGVLIFFLPILILGVYLTQVGIEIELLERRKELGLIRIRGAPKSKRYTYILIEAIIYSLSGGIAGYLLGLLFAYYANIVYMKFPYYHLVFDPIALIASIIFATILFFIALYKPLKKIKEATLIELISHYTQKFKNVEYSYGRDLVLSVFLWSYMIGGIYLASNFNYYLEGEFGVIFILVGIYLFSFIFMFPIVIIFLPLTTSRLLTMGTTKIYHMVASGISKITKISGDLARRSLEREPKRAAYLAFILSFILAFSTMWGVVIDEGNTIKEYQAIAEVGGDFMVQMNSMTHWEKVELRRILNDTSLVSNYAIIGLKRNAVIMQQEAWFTNFLEYTKSVHKIRDFVKEGEITSGTVIVGEDFAENNGIKVGDTVVVSTPEKDKIYKVSAILYTIPGMGADTFLIDSKISNDAMWKNSTLSLDTLIIRAKNVDALEEKLRDLFPFEYTSLYSVEGRENIIVDSYSGIMLGALLLMGAAAIVIVQYSLYLNRRGEIALYKVRGARTSQIGKLLLTEGGAIILIAIFVGLAVGFALGYMFSYMSFMGQHIPRIFKIGSHFLTGLISLSLVFFVTQYVLGYIFAKTNPDYIIRSMGGEL